MPVLCITVIYIILSIAVGIISSRNTGKTTGEFFVSHGNMSFSLLIPLLFGELVAGAGTVGNAAGAFTSGISAVWGVWGQAIGCFIFVIFAAPFFFKAGKEGCMSVAEAFERRFDKRVKTAVSVIVLIAFSIVYAMQPAAMAGILEAAVGVDKVWLAAACTVIFVIMALLGLKGIAKMNVVHSILIFSILLILAVISLSAAGGISSLSLNLNEKYFSLFVPDFKSSIGEILGAAFAMISAATVVNSCYCAKSISDARKGIAITAFMVMTFATFPVIIGLSGKVLYPEGNPNSIIYVMAERVSPLFSALASVSILASVLSTAPALLLNLSATVTRDIYKNIRPDSGDSEQLFFSKLMIIVFALIGLLLSFGMESILNEWLASFQIRSIVGIVLIISLYWKKVNSSAAFWSILVGGIMATIWHYIGNPYGIQPFWVSFVLGMILLAGISVFKKE